MSQTQPMASLKETFLCDRLFHHHHLSQEPASATSPPHLELCPFMGTPYILPDDKPPDLCIQRERLAVFHGVVVSMLAGPEVSSRQDPEEDGQSREAGAFSWEFYKAQKFQIMSLPLGSFRISCH